MVSAARASPSGIVPAFLGWILRVDSSKESTWDVSPSQTPLSSFWSQKEEQAGAKSWAKAGVPASWTDLDPSSEVHREDWGRSQPFTKRSKDTQPQPAYTLASSSPLLSSSALFPSLQDQRTWEELRGCQSAPESPHPMF